jgi:aryl-alcohol dehydrogenase-like predicted oxidoreductase
MNKLALGTAQFGSSYGISNIHGQVEIAEIKRILSYAEKVDIRLIDTANSYGAAESNIGSHDLSKFDIVTKLKKISSSGTSMHSWVLDQVDTSLTKLGAESIYALLLHSPKDLLSDDGQDLIDALVFVKSKGLVKNIGISIYSPSELDELVPRFLPDIVQTPLNILDNSIVSSGWLYRLSDLGVEIHARSIFLQGLLLQEHKDRHNFFYKWRNELQKVDDWVEYSDQTVLEACLGHALSFEEISYVVVGVTSVLELEQIVTSIPETTVRAPEHLSSTDHNLILPTNWQTN